MPQQLGFTALEKIKELEALRNSRVLVFAASHLEIEILPVLYEQLLEIGKVERLDVVLQGRGGVVNGARRIALLLRQFTDHLGFIIPHYCESSCTILALAADEIVAGDLAIFSPIDPHLHGSVGAEGEVSAFSCLDIKLFSEMSADWFGVSSEEARLQSLSILCNSIFPPTLTGFYRTTLELKQIGEELLKFQLPEKSNEFRQAIITKLMFGYHSHNYAITGHQMEEIGLNIRRDHEVEKLAWDISKVLQGMVGGGLRQSADEPWNDVLLVCSDSMKIRQKRNDGFIPSWTETKFLP
ncbi:MAG: SDH family Clp fold serine proteinase [Arenimonas sp.]